MDKSKNILVIRPDRIGDVVLSLPVLDAIKSFLPHSKVSVLVKNTVSPILKTRESIERILIFEPEGRHKGLLGSLRLCRELKPFQFDTAITLQANFYVSLALWLTKIPTRIGPFSKWFSFLFFNKGIKQNRSQVNMHEAEYNLEVLTTIGFQPKNLEFEPLITPDPLSRATVQELLKKTGVREEKPLVVVHPGMGGSALNWSESNYVSLIDRLARVGVQVIISGSEHERELVFRIKEKIGTQKLIYDFIGSSSEQGLLNFISLLSFADLVVAPSTGPLHLAAALGARTVSFYPPIRVQSQKRWGPYSKHADKHSVFVPPVHCPETFQCAGKSCSNFYCMDKINVDTVVRHVMDCLSKV